MVPDRKRALLRIRGQLGAEPQLLRRSNGHRDLIVEHHDVPGTKIVAVVILGGVAGEIAEVQKETRCRRLLVVVLADRRPRPRLVGSSPRWIVAVIEVGERCVAVGIIARGEHRGARVSVEQRPCGIVVGAITPCDIAGADQHRG